MKLTQRIRRLFDLARPYRYIRELEADIEAIQAKNTEELMKSAYLNIRTGSIELKHEMATVFAAAFGGLLVDSGAPNAVHMSFYYPAAHEGGDRRAVEVEIKYAGSKSTLNKKFCKAREFLKATLDHSDSLEGSYGYPAAFHCRLPASLYTEIAGFLAESGPIPGTDPTDELERKASEVVSQIIDDIDNADTE